MNEPDLKALLPTEPGVEQKPEIILGVTAGTFAGPEIEEMNPMGVVLDKPLVLRT